MVEEKPVLFISGLQCSGKSFLHGLLRNSPEIFTIPWGIHYFIAYEKMQFDKMSHDEIADYWCKYFRRIQNQEIPDKQELGRNPILDELDISIFRECFLKNIRVESINVKTLFFFLHYSYAEAAGIELSNVKYIGYEHTLYVPFKKTIAMFDKYKIIQLTKDMSNLFISVINRTVVKQGITDLESFVKKLVKAYELSADMDKKSNGKMKYVRLEDILRDRESVLRRICVWLEIGYDKCVEESCLSGYPFTQRKVVKERKLKALKSVANCVFRIDQIRFGYVDERDKNRREKWWFLVPLPNELVIANYNNKKYVRPIGRVMAYSYVNMKVLLRKLPQYISSRKFYYEKFIAREFVLPDRKSHKILQ